MNNWNGVSRFTVGDKTSTTTRTTTQQQYKCDFLKTHFEKQNSLTLGTDILKGGQRLLVYERGY